MLRRREVEGSRGYEKGIELLSHFRAQLRALSDARTLEILKSFGSRAFMNREVRERLGGKRGTTWAMLSRLVQLGLLEKRGHTYAVSPFAKDFTSAIALTFRGLLTNSEITVPTPAIVTALRLASQGVELLYSKGKIAESEYFEFRKALNATAVSGASD